MRYDREKHQKACAGSTAGGTDGSCYDDHPHSDTDTGLHYLGDGMVLICGILLGPGLGALAAGIGSMMADLIGGYMAWVPGTFAIKALTALLGGWLYHRMAGKGMNTITRVVLCGIPAEIVMVLGYFVYEVGMEVVMGVPHAAAYAGH